MSRIHDGATTAVQPHISLSTPDQLQRAARIYPALALLSVVLLFLTAAAGIALSAVVLFLNLESTEVLDPLSRAVFFVASCMSLTYVITHIIASRTAYIKSYGSPKAYGKYVAQLAFLLARLGLPVWVAATIFAIFVAVNIGLDLSNGIQENIPWLNVIICITSLFSLAAVLAVIEMADRPFATFGFSQAWFIRGEDPLASPDDYDLEPGSTESMPLFQEKQEKKHEEHDKAEKKQKRKRKTLTKRSPYEKHHRNLRHARSVSMPAPLNTVFNNQPGPRLPESPDFHSSFAWKPPTRDGATRPKTGAVTFDDWVTWQEHVNMHQAASDISTDASARPDEMILPSMPPHVEYSPRSKALLRQDRRYDLRRWTAIGMQSPPFDGDFLAVPFRRPVTPLMTMEEEHRIMGRRATIINGNWEANYHLKMMQNSRPSSSQTTRPLRSPRSGMTAKGKSRPAIPRLEIPPPRRAEITDNTRPYSNTMPNEGRRRQRIPSVGLNDNRHLEYRTERRVTSQYGSRLSIRPPSQHRLTAAHAPRLASPTTTIRSTGSDIYNFSRPRTSAAARMQSKVAKRLRAMKQQQETESSMQEQIEAQAPLTLRLSSISPMPIVTRVAAVQPDQEKLGGKNRQYQQDDEHGPPSPATPRTARATAVKNLRERLGKRIMRGNEVETMRAT